jgi:hypothetical protein
MLMQEGRWWLVVNRRFLDWIKICGITNSEDAQAAVAEGTMLWARVFGEESAAVMVETVVP